MREISARKGQNKKKKNCLKKKLFYAEWTKSWCFKVKYSQLIFYLTYKKMFKATSTLKVN